MYYEIEKYIVVCNNKKKFKENKSKCIFIINEGIWKCHDCIWTYKIGQSWVYHLHQKPFNQGGQ